MKLSLLESGVLDYKGDALTLATPVGAPTASMGAGVKPAPKLKSSNFKKFKDHIKNCPYCNTKICETGQRLSNNL